MFNTIHPYDINDSKIIQYHVFYQISIVNNKTVGFSKANSDGNIMKSQRSLIQRPSHFPLFTFAQDLMEDHCTTRPLPGIL